MSALTDLEITRLCAEARNYAITAYRNFIEVLDYSGAFPVRYIYDPLHDDAQAMALDEVILQDNHGFWMDQYTFVRYEHPAGMNVFEFHADMTKAENRRRARCECIAIMRIDRS